MSGKQSSATKQKNHITAIPAKIAPPRISNCFQRQRLFRLLDSYQDKSLVWISGPAGCGKTTLVASYLKSRNIDHIWYQVDSRDKDPATLFYYLGLFVKYQSQNQHKSLPMMRPEHLEYLSIFCRNYFEAFYELCRPTPVLVFDNIQIIPDGAYFFQILQYLATQIPPGGHVFLISRFEPPLAFARMLVHREIALLRWGDFQLTPEEIQKFSLKIYKTELTCTQADTIYAKTLGWVAAVVILLAQSDSVLKSFEPRSIVVPELLFEYFANEIFAQFDMGTQEFLLKTAWLPQMNVTMANKVTGHNHADRILSGLSSKNFFTIQHGQGKLIRYEYHPLFKDFLKNQAGIKLSSKIINKIRYYASTLLIKEQRFEEAAELLQDTRQWGRLGELICEQAGNLIEHGRFGILYDWVCSIPEKILQKNPWLLYWQAVSRLPFAPGESKLYFEKAFALFEHQQDVDGCYYAWSGIANAIIYQQVDFRQLDRWVDVLNRLRNNYPELPTIELAAQLANSVLTQFHFRAIQSTHFETWLKQAESFWFRVPNINMRIELASNILEYHSKKGNYTQSKQIVNALNKLVKTIDPLSNAWIVAHMRIGLFYWHWGNNDMAMQYYIKAMESAQAGNIHVWDCLIWALGVYASMCIGDLDQAESFIEKIGTRLAGQGPNLDTAHYYSLVGWHAFIVGKINFAVEMYTKALDISERVGAIAPSCYSYNGLANALFAKGDIDRALTNISNAMNNVAAQKLPSIQYQCILTEAYFEIKEGNQNEGLILLNKALSLGRKHGFSQTSWWHADIMAYLCSMALSKNIEVPWVRELIRKFNLRPDKTLISNENWPWPIKIYTLGRFAIEKDGVPIKFSAKTPKKPLDMIKTLIALGGHNVNKELVCDALWPDAEGDNANRAFKTTLHRARRILGNDNAVKVQGGKLNMNSDLCWVDCWDFDRLLSQAVKASVSINTDQAINFLEKAVELYKGPFLAKDEWLPWAITFRERLRDTLLRALDSICSNMNSHDQHERTAVWYRQLIDTDVYYEAYYRRLMLCLKQLGQKNEAISVYNLCKNNFAALDISPSPETKDIYRSMLVSS